MHTVMAGRLRSPWPESSGGTATKGQTALSEAEQHLLSIRLIRTLFLPP